MRTPATDRAQSPSRTPVLRLTEVGGRAVADDKDADEAFVVELANNLPQH